MHFLQRQQVHRACSFVLANEFSALWEFLRSPDRVSYFEGMPVWWTPCIHDLALIIGCAKYGFVNLDYLREDLSLPFRVKKIERHLRYCIQYETLSVIPVAVDALTTERDDLENWIRTSSQEFPEQRLLEMRLEKILEEVTRDLTNGHPCRVSSICDRLSGNGVRLHSIRLEEAITLRLDLSVTGPLSTKPLAPLSFASSASTAPPPATAVEAKAPVEVSVTDVVADSVEGAAATSAPAEVTRSPTLKPYLAQIVKGRRISMSEFRPARPSSFEICEYSEKPVVVGVERAHSGGGGMNYRLDDEYDDDDDDDDYGGVEPPIHLYKTAGSYSSYKKGV